MNRSTTILQVFLSLIILASASSLSAQCPDGEETTSLDSQAEVDAFIMNNPSCTHIEELEFGGDVTDLSGFESVTSMNYLYFTGTSALQDLSGFRNLDSVFGNLGFYNELGFSDLCGLESLQFIGQDLRLEDTEGVVTLRGIETLTYIEDDITITGNLDLENVEGLHNLTAIGGINPNESHYIQLFDNPKLFDCCAIAIWMFDQQDLIWEVFNNKAGCDSVGDIAITDCIGEFPSCMTSSTADLTLPFVNIFPNPASNFVEITNENGDINSVQLVNLQGQKMKVEMNADNQLSLSRIPAGFYTMVIEINDNWVNHKLVVLK